jgi:pimeloyl-ACP methyl ester carboxylesterase
LSREEVMAMSEPSSGFLGDGVPYMAIGEGPPLVKVEGGTPTHDVPTGWMRRMYLSAIAPLSGDFRVYWVNRKKGLQPGESMSDIAGHLATAIEHEFGGPVFLTGTSTGGSVALQLAVDRPDLVRAFVLISSAYRLGPRGREIQQDLARLTRSGDGAVGLARILTALMPVPLRGPVYPVARLMCRSMAPEDPADMLVTLDAEDAFDVGEQLDQVTAPTLVIGGAKDVLYTRELFEQTAARVQDGRAHIYPDRGHLGASESATTAHITLGFLLAARETDRPS